MPLPPRQNDVGSSPTDRVLRIRRGRVALQVMKLPALMAPLYGLVIGLEQRSFTEGIRRAVLFGVLWALVAGLWFRRDLSLRSVTLEERAVTLASAGSRQQTLDVSPGFTVQGEGGVVPGAWLRTSGGERAHVPSAVHGLTPGEVLSALEALADQANVP